MHLVDDDGGIWDIVPRKEGNTEFHQTLGDKKATIEPLDDDPAPCPDHPGKTLYHKQGKYGPFWSHKNDDGTYHNIRG